MAVVFNFSYDALLKASQFFSCMYLMSVQMVMVLGCGICVEAFFLNGSLDTLSRMELESKALLSSGEEAYSTDWAVILFPNQPSSA